MQILTLLRIFMLTLVSAYPGYLNHAKPYFYSTIILTQLFPLQDKFEATCHLLAHLAYVAFKIVPEDFQELITIILLDIFNQCLSCVSAEDIDKRLDYLQGIINMVSHSDLRLAMTNTMGKMLSKERK